MLTFRFTQKVWASPSKKEKGEKRGEREREREREREIHIVIKFTYLLGLTCHCTSKAWSSLRKKGIE